MNIELIALLVTGIMTYLTILFQQLNMSATQGADYSVSNRDKPIKETALAGRLRRAAKNGVEAVAIFTPLVMVATLQGISNTWTEYASIAIIVSRVSYLPAYALGLVPVRTIVWSLGFFALPFFAYGVLGG